MNKKQWQNFYKQLKKSRFFSLFSIGSGRHWDHPVGCFCLYLRDNHYPEWTIFSVCPEVWGGRFFLDTLLWIK